MGKPKKYQSADAAAVEVNLETKDERELVSIATVKQMLDVQQSMLKYITLYNDCFPLKKVKAKNVTLSNPWITKDLLKSVRKNNLLYKRFLAKPTSYRENLYKCYKNKLTHSLRVAL